MVETGKQQPAIRAEPARLMWPNVPPLVVDVCLAIAALTLSLPALAGSVTHISDGARFRSADRVAFILIALSTLPLLLRRRWPWAVLVFTTACFYMAESIGYSRAPVPYGPLIAAFTVATRSSAALTAAAAAIVIAGAAVSSGVHHESLKEDPFVADIAAILVVTILGHSVFLSRIRAALLHDQAERLRNEQDARTALAVEREVSRIARELHDIVAHHMSVIIALAGVSRRVFDLRPEQARESLPTIESLGREALTELRRLLGVMHSDEADSDRAPQPSLEQLPAVVEQVRRAGVPVDLTVTGTVRALPPGLALNAYRIVQEALTNSLKHAGGAAVMVKVNYLPEAIELDIHDDGQAAALSRSGNGLIGMQQRAALLRGDLTVGPGANGGFDVHARLPIDAGAQ